MRKEGFSYAVIIAELGFSSSFMVRYHTDDDFKRRVRNRIKKHQTKNREHFLEKMREYSRKRNAEKKGRLQGKK